MALRRAYYGATISEFLISSSDAVLGQLVRRSEFPVEQAQRDAWLEEISILQMALNGYDGAIFLEYSIPRMGRRIDAVLVIGPAIFVLEFKVGEKEFARHALDQVWDYALDLKNFHEPSYERVIAPVLIPTESKKASPVVSTTAHDDKLLVPVRCTPKLLTSVIDEVLRFAEGSAIDPDAWIGGRYCPTPTIIEAATALYGGHSVDDISRNDADAINLSETSDAVSEIIVASEQNREKSICFVTGVPGAGKTLVGLDIANKHRDKSSELYSVFLSGNGPLVKVLCEALARDKVYRERQQGRKVAKGEAVRAVKSFIQNVHHFRDDCLADPTLAPVEHVALFDEAQRAWNLHQTADFMKRKKGTPDFRQSEPEFLISCLDRHSDWAVVVCLIGGGQEINKGEAGVSGWIDSIRHQFPDWHVYISPRLTDSEYAAGHVLEDLKVRDRVTYKSELHLSVSMRSFRAENVSEFVKHALDLDADAARATLDTLSKYPIMITRQLREAKEWLKSKARGSERYGIVVSSQAERLRPHAIQVKAKSNPIHWFLNGKDDVRASYYLEDVATEFEVQGLELDWSCVTWDADFRFTPSGWDHWQFRGKRWNRIKKSDRQVYLKNAYRVLLTRARQGMVIVVPEGDPEDPTRNSSYYDPTYEYLRGLGLGVL